MPEPKPQALAANSRNWFRQLSRFTLVGGAATAIQYALLVLFVDYFAINSIASSALSYAIAACANYLLNYYLTFSGAGNHSSAFIKFVLSCLVGLAINTAVFAVAQWLFKHYMIAQLVATAVTYIANFCMHRYWIYGTQK